MTELLSTLAAWPWTPIALFVLAGLALIVRVDSADFSGAVEVSEHGDLAELAEELHRELAEFEAAGE